MIFSWLNLDASIAAKGDVRNTIYKKTTNSVDPDEMVLHCPCWYAGLKALNERNKSTFNLSVDIIKYSQMQNEEYIMHHQCKHNFIINNYYSL